ncbi:MAG: tRNA lysidine(34) synthetase TilS [Bryobacteraceae bacterium]
MSGGADSTCLLLVLRQLAPRWNLQLEVLHLNHGLRGAESAADASSVRDLAQSLGLPVHIEERDVAGQRRRTRDNLEQAGRKARHDFFLSFLAAGKLDRVATGHTRSDQAETVLFRFLRGSGGAGLAGIRPFTSGGLVRPLLDIAREDVEAHLAALETSWCNDATNASLAFARNRIRHQLLPSLTRDWNPQLAETLAQTADWAFEEERHWSAEIDRLAARHIKQCPPAVLLDAGPLRLLTRAAARRLVRRALEYVRSDLLRLTFRHVDRILDLATGPQGHGRLQVPGVDVTRSFEWTQFVPAGVKYDESHDFKFQLALPGRLALPNQECTLVAELIESSGEGECVYNTIVSNLAWDRLTGPLELRNWRPGDRYQPAGSASPSKLKDMFQHARVPAWERRGWPVMEADGEIVWTRRFGPASSYAADFGSRSILRVWEER